MTSSQLSVPAHQAIDTLATLLEEGAGEHNLVHTLNHALKVYEQFVRPHFAWEEKHLFTACAGLHTEIDQFIYMLRDDQAEIDNMFQKLLGETNQRWLLDQLAEVLRTYLQSELSLLTLVHEHAGKDIRQKLQNTDQGQR